MSETTEVWRDVPGYEGRYQVSDQGRVRSLDRDRGRDSRGRPRFKAGVIYSPTRTGGNPYPRVVLSRGTPPVTRSVHSLVTEAFLGPRPAGLEVLHRNGDPTDNRLSNLHYGTRSENQRDAVAHGHNHWASQTHCVWGHPFDEDNTYLRPDGGRGCRVCLARGSRLYQAKKKRAATTLEIGAQ